MDYCGGAGRDAASPIKTGQAMRRIVSAATQHAGDQVAGGGRGTSGVTETNKIPDLRYDSRDEVLRVVRFNFRVKRPMIAGVRRPRRKNPKRLGGAWRER
jgi:hypothetical protein